MQGEYEITVEGSEDQWIREMARISERHPLEHLEIRAADLEEIFFELYGEVAAGGAGRLMSYVLAIAFRDFRIRLSNPVLPLWDVLVPVVYLLVFGSSLERWIGAAGSGLDYPRFFLGGVLSMVSFGIVFNSSYAFFEDLQGGIFHEMLTYPFARWEMLLGKLLFNAAFSVVGVAVCCMAAVYVLLNIAMCRRRRGCRLRFWSVVGTAGWYFLFTWLALNLRGFNAYHTTTSALYLVLMFISNLFYPDAAVAGGQCAGWRGRIQLRGRRTSALLHVSSGRATLSCLSRRRRLSSLCW